MKPLLPLLPLLPLRNLESKMDLKYLRYLIALLLPLVAQAQDTTIDDYPSSGVPATNDLLYLLDVDDTNDGPKGSNKKLTIANLLNVQPQYGSTGVLTGGVLSTGAGATEFSISDGTGIITTAAGARTAVSWSGKSNITPANIATNLLTWVAIDSGGNVVESTTPFTASQSRSNIVLGVVVHVNKTTVDNVNNEQFVVYQPANTTHDLADAIGFINVSGNVFTANGANLNINKSEGTMFKMGANYNVDSTNPHNRTLAALSPATFQYRFSDGSNGVTGTAIDPDNLDNGAGGLTAVGTNRWSIQRIYSFVSNNVKIQRGVADYGTLTAAVDGIASEAYVTEQSIADNGLLRGWLVVKRGATDLSDPAAAKFISAPKFGEGTAETASAAGAFAANSTTAIVPTSAIVLDEATGNEVALSLDYTVNKATSGNDTGLKINMTDTASPGTSLLADFQTGGTPQFQFTNAGVFSFSTDVKLQRDAANTLALRNSTNAQEFRVYNTHTGAADEWLGLTWGSNIATIKTATAGGTNRALRLESQGSRLLHQTGATSNTFVGYDAGNYSVSGGNNTAVGDRAGLALSSGAGNTALGRGALSAETTNSNNVAVGYQSLTAQNGAIYNTAIGRNAGVAITTGGYNVMIGGLALDSETASALNVAIGYASLAGQNGGTGNIGVGYQAADNITTGDYNLILGYNIDAQSATNSNQMSIGNLLFSQGIDGTGTTVSTGNLGVGVVAPDTKLDVNGALTIREKNSDPANPDEGATVIWQSDGTGFGDDGDVVLKITAGGVTKTHTLVDFSAITDEEP